MCGTLREAKGSVQRRLWRARRRQLRVRLQTGPTLVEKYDTVLYSDFAAKLANLGGLVLFCIGTNLCDQILILQHFSRSTVAPIGRKKSARTFLLPKKKIHLAEIKGGRFCG